MCLCLQPSQTRRHVKTPQPPLLCLQELPWVAAAASAVSSSPPRATSPLRVSRASSSTYVPPKQLESQLSPATAQLAELRGFSAELRSSTDGLDQP